MATTSSGPQMNVEMLLAIRDAVTPALRAIGGRFRDFASGAIAQVRALDERLRGANQSEEKLKKNTVGLGESFGRAKGQVAALGASLLALSLIEYTSVQKLADSLEQASRYAISWVQQSVDVAKRFEATTRGITSQISAAFNFSNDPAKQLASALGQARNYTKELADDAKRLPGSFQDFADTSQMILGTMLASGKSMEDVRDLINDAAIASAVLGRSMNEVGRGIGFMLQGSTGRDNPLFRILLATGAIKENAREFNRLMPKERAEAVQKALKLVVGPLRDSVYLTESWEIQWDQLRENIHGVTGFVGTLGTSLLPELALQAKRLNDWFMANEETVNRIAQAIAAGVLPWARAAVDVALQLAEALKEIPDEAIIQFIANIADATWQLWLRVKVMVAGIQAFTTILAAVVVRFGELAGLAIANAGNFFTALVEVAQTAFQAIRVFAQSLFEWAKQYIVAFWNWVSSGVQGFINAAKSYFYPFFAEVLGWVQALLQSISNPLFDLSGPAKQVGELKAQLEGTAKAIEKANVEAAKTPKAIQQFASFNDIYGKLVQFYVKPHEQAAKEAVNALQDAWTEFTSSGRLSDTLFELGTRAWDVLVLAWNTSAAARPLAPTIVEQAGEALKAIKDRAAALAAEAANPASGVRVNANAENLDAAEKLAKTMAKLKDQQIKDALKGDRILTAQHRAFLQERLADIRKNTNEQIQEIQRLKAAGALKDEDAKIYISLVRDDSWQETKEILEAMEQTDIERINIEISELNDSIEHGTASALDGATAAWKEWQAEALNTAQQVKDGTAAILNVLTQSLTTGIHQVIDGTKTWGEVFQDVGNAILDKLLEIVIQMLVVQALSYASGGATTGLLALFGNEGGGSGALGLGILGLAKGGVVSRPSFAMIGEGGGAEAVVPLPDNRSIPVKFQGPSGAGASGASNSGESSGEGPVPIQFQMNINAVDSADFQRKLAENKRAFNRMVREAINSDTDVRNKIRQVGKR